MAKTLAELKKSRGGFETLVNKVKNMDSKDYNDPTYWQPTTDKAGNGMAIIRFLPAPPGEDLPYVEIFSHGFKVNGKWYIENCRTTIGEEDPVVEHCNALWDRINAGESELKEAARARKRKLHYHTNIYIVKDYGNPDNDGKVFRFRFGPKLFEKITAAMSPEFEDEQPMNPFDPWEGADFKLKVRKVDGNRNYDLSGFSAPSELGDDDMIDEVWNKTHSLAKLLEPSNFKPYDVLKKRLDFVLGSKGGNSEAEESKDDDSESAMKQEEAPRRRVREPEPEEPKSTPAAKPPVDMDDEDDDSLEYFKRLAAED